MVPPKALYGSRNVFVRVEPSEELRKAREALAKAQGHLQAADAIAARGDYSMAFSHLVLSLEEWSKQRIHEGLDMGLAESGTPDRTNPFRIPEATEFDHQKKQFIALFLAALLFPMKGRMKFVMDCEEAGRQPSKEELTNRLMRDLEVSEKLLALAGRLEAMKQFGLYSGEKAARGKRTTPVSRENFEWLRPIVAEHLEIEAFTVEHPLTAQQVAQAHEQVKKLQDRLRPQAQKLLDIGKTEKAGRSGS